MISIDERPFSFDEMVGHDSIIKRMKAYSLDMSFPEVMIFEGATGTGKTTLAYIVSALLSDPNPIKKDDCFDPNPESPSVIAIRNEVFGRDVYMKDASSMSKDDILDLEGIVSSRASRDGKKVIIIDEAQELSKAGKGATLKLLEKKRQNTYFILCTMSANAFPEDLKKALLSRMQVFKFKEVEQIDIAQYLFNIIDKRGIEVPGEFLSEGLMLIAEMSRGSVRQAAQYLEACISGEFFTKEKITEEFSIITEANLTEILNSILTGNYEIFTRMKSVDHSEFILKSLNLFKRTALVKFAEMEDFGVPSQWTEDSIYSKIKEFTKVLLRLLEYPWLNDGIFSNELLLFMGADSSMSLQKPSETIPKKVPIPAKIQVETPKEQTTRRVVVEDDDDD